MQRLRERAHNSAWMAGPGFPGFGVFTSTARRGTGGRAPIFRASAGNPPMLVPPTVRAQAAAESITASLQHRMSHLTGLVGRGRSMMEAHIANTLSPDGNPPLVCTICAAWPLSFCSCWLGRDTLRTFMIGMYVWVFVLGACMVDTTVLCLNTSFDYLEQHGVKLRVSRGRFARGPGFRSPCPRQGSEWAPCVRQNMSWMGEVIASCCCAQIDEEGLAALVALLRLSLPLQKYHLQKLFSNLVWHPVTRKTLLRLLMSLLRMPLSADEAEGSFHGKANRPLPRRSPAPSLAAALQASTQSVSF